MEINSFVCCVLSLIIVQMHRTWNVLCLGHTRRKAFFIISLNSFRECVVKLEGDFSRERDRQKTVYYLWFGQYFDILSIYWAFRVDRSIDRTLDQYDDLSKIVNKICLASQTPYNILLDRKFRFAIHLNFKKNNFKLVSLLQHNTNNRFFRSFKNKYFTIVLSLRFLFCAISQFYL